MREPKGEYTAGSVRKPRILGINSINFLAAAHMVALSKIPDVIAIETENLSDLRIRDAEALKITDRDEINDEVLGGFPNLRFVLTTSKGFDHVDLAACSNRGVLVSNLADYATISAAEHALGLMMAVSRKTVQAVRSMEQGRWEQVEPVLRGFDLYGKKLGIIGFGRIGQRLATIAEPLGMEISSADIVDDDVEKTRARRAQLLKESDIISLHVTLTKPPHPFATKHLIGRREIDLMKGGVIIVNTSRGQVIDEHALVSGLSEGKIGGAGLDVYEVEPLELNHPLREFPNVVLTPHLGAQTYEARVRASEESFRAIDGYFRGKLINLVNG